MRTRLLLTSLAIAAGCNGSAEHPPDGGADAAGPADAGDLADAAEPTDAGDDVDAAPPAPWIGDALDCMAPAEAGGLAPGTALQRVNLDTEVFPDARCNDGTAAFFYFRPAATELARDRWVIQLQGGGGCSTPDQCAERWCSVDTNFGATQMTNTLSPAEGIRGDGILRRGGAFGEPNPVGDWNHVFVRYCSSDGWAGTAGEVDLDGHHPISGEPVRFRIALDGSHIVDAVLDTLRQDGAAPPAYTLGRGSEELPDLDDAVGVLFAGASAGGAGVTANADRVRDVLRAENADLEYMAIIDSHFAPALETLDFSTSTWCELGGCDYATYMSHVAAQAIDAPRLDESCLAWHAANEPDTAWQCADDGHVIRNHLASPMLVRMGLTDELVSSGMIEAMYTAPDGELMDLEHFAELVADGLTALPGSTPEEPFEQAPAVFGPPCAKHEALSADDAVFATTLSDDGTAYTMFDLLTNAYLGASPTALVWAVGDPIDCP